MRPFWAGKAVGHEVRVDDLDKPELDRTAHDRGAGRLRPVKPGFVEIVNPDLVAKPPSGPKWAHGFKWGGYRAQAHLKGKHVKMFKRQANDWTGKLGPISEALPKLRSDNL